MKQGGVWHREWSCERDGHTTVVTYTRRLRDGFRRRMWMRCWDCDLRIGPLPPADKLPTELKPSHHC